MRLVGAAPRTRLVKYVCYGIVLVDVIWFLGWTAIWFLFRHTCGPPERDCSGAIAIFVFWMFGQIILLPAVIPSALYLWFTRKRRVVS